MVSANDLSDEEIRLLMASVARFSEYQALSNEELAGVLTNEIWAHMYAHTAESDLLMEVIDRLENMED